LDVHRREEVVVQREVAALDAIAELKQVLLSGCLAEHLGDVFHEEDGPLVIVILVFFRFLHDADIDFAVGHHPDQGDSENFLRR